MKTILKTKSKLCLTACLCLFTTISVAQTATIIGKVVSSRNNQPIESATVSVKGKNTVATTDQEGKFSISTKAGNLTLVFSFLSTQPVEKTINAEAGKTNDIATIKFDVKDNELKEVVVDGMIKKFAEKRSDYVARMPLKNLENPQVYTVVPKELFTEQVSFDLQSVLATSPGVGNPSAGPGSGGIGLGISMRGFSSLNGIGAIRNGMATNFVTLSDPANIESLEVIKGPSSTLFGTTLVAYGGLINRVTKKAHVGESGEIGLTTGSNGLGRVTIDYNKPLNEDKTLLFRINSAIHREKSFQDFGINRTFMLAPTFTYHVSDRLTLDLDIEYFQSERNATFVRVSTGSGITNMDQLNWNFKKSYTSNEIVSKSKAFTVYAKANYKLSEQWTSQTLYSYANTENQGNYVFLQVNKKDTITPFLMSLPSTFTTHQVQQNFIGDFKIGSFRNRLIIGADYTQLTNLNSRTTIYYSNAAISGTFKPNLYQYETALGNAKWSDALRYEKTFSVYASDVFNVTDRLLVMAALRLDRFNDVENDYKQTALSPKFGLVYQLLKDKLSVFGNFMDGFKNVAPALTEDEGNKAFKPEHATQYEGGVKLELFNGKLSSTVSYYDITVRKRLTPYNIAGSKDTYYTQDGTQNSKGFEIDLIANPVTGMHIILGYGFNDNEYTKGQYEGKRPYGVSKNIANFWISHKLTTGKFSGFGVGFGGNYASDHFLEATNTITVPGYTKFDATVFYDQPKYRIGLKLNNIGNEKYWMSSFNATPQATRSFLANISFRF
jgi:iron complex outermembrane receptor protein